MNYPEAIKVLNLSNSYTEEDLNKSFKSLSKKYHPDINKEPEAERKYKEISEAYHYLKDYKHNHNNIPNQNGDHFPGDIFTHYFNLDDFIFGVKNNKFYTEVVVINLTFLEGALGCTKEIDFKKRNEKDEEVKMKVKLNFKPGVENNTIFIQSGAGSYNKEVRKFNNVEFKIHIAPHPAFTKSGNNIESNLKISLLQALEGGTVSLDTIHGLVKVDLKPGLKNKDRVILRNKGINTGSFIGDHILNINVLYPENTQSLINFLKEKNDFSSNVSQS